MPRSSPDVPAAAASTAALVRLAVLIVLSVFVYAAMTSTRMAISLTTVSLTHSTAMAGVMGGVYSLMPIAVGLAAGRLIDRFGIFGPLAGASVLMLLGLMAPFAWPGVPTLMLAAMGQGAGFTLAGLALTNAAAMSEPVEHRTRNLAWVFLGNSAGMALGPLVAGFAIDHLGHRGSFGVLGVFPLVSLALLMALRHQLPRARGLTRVAGARTLDLLRSEGLRRLLVVQALTGLTLESFYFLVPLHGAQIGLSAAVIGTVLACAFATNFLCRVVLPGLVRRFGEVNVIAAAFVVVALSIAPLGHVHVAGAMMALAAGCGITHGIVYPVLTSLFYGASPAGREGEMAGVRTMVANATNSGTQFAAGALSASVGIAPVMWAMGAVALGGAWFVRRHVRLALA